MSEHIKITGKVIHLHSPQEVFAYCFRCKNELNRLTIEINQGFMGFSVTARCPKCDRAIWTAGIDDYENNMTYWHKKKDKKCAVCKKTTNEKDSYCYGGKGKKMEYWCSKDCFERRKE